MNEHVVTVLITVVSASGFWGVLQWLLDTKMKSRKKQIDAIHNTLIELKKEMTANNNLTLSLGRDRVNFLCNKFAELGYIPKEDNISFLLIGKAYCESGNTEVKTKFEWCVKNLPVK